MPPKKTASEPEVVPTEAVKAKTTSEASSEPSETPTKKTPTKKNKTTPSASEAETETDTESVITPKPNSLAGLKAKAAKEAKEAKAVKATKAVKAVKPTAPIAEAADEEMAEAEPDADAEPSQATTTKGKRRATATLPEKIDVILGQIGKGSIPAAIKALTKFRTLIDGAKIKPAKKARAANAYNKFIADEMAKLKLLPESNDMDSTQKFSYCISRWRDHKAAIETAV
jgi:hypothetical protein